MVTFFPFSAFTPDGGHYGRTLDRAKNVLPMHAGYRSLRKNSRVANVLDGPMTGAYVHIYQQSLAEQVARPDADTTLGLWLPNSGTTLFSRIKEETPSDAEYITALGAPLNEVCKLSLSDISAPSAGSHTFRFRYGVGNCSTAGAAVAVSSITRAGAVATVTTAVAHGYASGDYVAVDGAGQAEYNVTAAITVTGGTTFTYAVSGTPATPATGTITVRKITTAAVTSITRAGAVATVTTTLAHGLATNDWAYHFGAVQPEYNGVFQVTVTGPTTYTVAVTGAPATPATGTIKWAKAWALKLELVEGVTVRQTDIVGGTSDLLFTQRSTSFAAPAVTDWTNLFFQVTATCPGAPIFLRPSSDDSVGGWATHAGSGANLYQTVDETPADDADYVQSPTVGVGGSAAYTLNLGTSSQLVVAKTHTVRYRYFATNAGMTLKVELLQGASVVATWTHASVAAGAWTAGSQALTAPQRDAIKAGGGYSGLKLRFTASYPSSVTSTVFQFSRPNSDAGSFAVNNELGAPAPLYSSVDEAAPSDLDYVVGAGGGLDGSAAFTGSGVTSPQDSNAASHVMSVRAKAITAGNSLVAVLKNNGVTIKTLDFGAGTPGVGPLTGAFQTFSFALTAGEVASITNYGAGFDWTLTFYGANHGLNVTASWLEFKVPELRRMRVSFAEMELPSSAEVKVSWAEYRTPTADTRYRGDLPTRFCGSRKNLYTFDTAGFVDTSAGGPLAPGAGPYGAGGSIPGSWYFASFGNHVVATNFTDAVQWRNNNTGQFAALITSADKPKARFCCAARDHLMLGSMNFVGADVNQVWWSAFQNIQDFQRGANQCDSRFLYATPGQIMGMVGGDTPLIFKRRSLYAFQWVGGKFVWQPIVVSSSVGTPFPRSIVSGQDKTMWWGGDCFYQMAQGGQPQELGRGILSRFLTDAEFSDGAIKPVDPTEMRVEDQIMEGWYDPGAGLFLWHYQGLSDGDWQHSRAVVYDPAEDRWALLDLGAYVVGDIAYLPTRMSAATQLPNTTTSATNELRGTLGIEWDGINTTWFRFDGATTYGAEFRSKWFAVQLDEQEQPVLSQIEGIIPVFSTALKPEGAWPTVSVKLEMALEPRSQFGYQTETYASSSADQRQMLPFRLGGLWARVTVSVGEMSAAIMDAFEGLYIEHRPRGTGGA